MSVERWIFNKSNDSCARFLCWQSSWHPLGEWEHAQSFSASQWHPTPVLVPNEVGSGVTGVRRRRWIQVRQFEVLGDRGGDRADGDGNFSSTDSSISWVVLDENQSKAEATTGSAVEVSVHFPPSLLLLLMARCLRT